MRSFLPESVALVEADLVRGDEAALQDALRGVNAVVVTASARSRPAAPKSLSTYRVLLSAVSTRCYVFASTGIA